MQRTTYSVWVLSGNSSVGDPRNQPKFISTHLSKKVADRVADLNSGYIEEDIENLHPDYIRTLEVQDINLSNAQRDISNSVRNMLSSGG